MTDRIRAALQRLAKLEGHILVDCTADWAEAMIEARAALAAEPVTDEAMPPRVGHILRLAEIIREVDGNHDKGAAALAEAILSHPRVRSAGLAAEPVAAPAEPTDDELWDIGERHLWTGTDESVTNYRILSRFITAARAVLSRYGHQPAPPVEGADCPACEGVPKPGNQPCAVCGRSASSVEREVAEMAWWLRSLEDASVWFESGSPEALKLTRAADLLEQRHLAPVPVAERLPRPGDCLDEGWAWFFSPRVGWRQAVLPVSPAFTHWLPATALPLPQGEVRP